jgi:hypothetical protein
MYAALERASRIMLVGAGAVGVELAGELAAAWPDKHVVLIDIADHILRGPYDQRLRDEINRQLDELGVERILGSGLIRGPGRVRAGASGDLAPPRTCRRSSHLPSQEDIATAELTAQTKGRDMMIDRYADLLHVEH